ncbi:DUF3179 domain-containing protein [Profundibacterium mesophilum]|uniref:DUF3179 domain-containing protein n=1 Tax=Profundibacterium mesophilum KAUST100406-0324 TaxID=1037889 RepID=A0A921NSY2_9RHOB|nr:DUF3179 domain-containing protein [Profundibacterium mesophilum]KAF0677435.1 hypothetical protein PMES_00221 [Profundibacterium mesophilum KAUST100406-0324]
MTRATRRLLAGLTAAILAAGGMTVPAGAQTSTPPPGQGAEQAIPEPPTFWRSEWPRTDFTKRDIESWTEIVSGGPGRDGIPALDDPDFLPAKDVDLPPLEPVVAVVIDGAAPRAYPLRYLTWHEIVNDTVAGIPVAVTFCPLCNSAMTFDRRVDGRVLRFGVTGKLRNSDMVMFDRETESWWQQVIGAAIVGELTGATLRPIPTWMESWERFKEREGAMVMAEPALPRAYGTNPYAGYDRSRQPFLYSGAPPPHGIKPLARVLRVGDKAWPLDRLRGQTPLREAGITIEWSAGQASALDDAVIARGRDVGMIRVRGPGGEDVVHDVMFAFAFHAFYPEGQWMLGG